MSVHRVLKKDISPLLENYGASIGAPVNNTKNRARIKEVLEHFDHHDEFYVEMDLRSGCITWAHGFKNWLRHPDPEINVTPNTFLADYVHPFIADWYRIFLLAMIKIFTERTTHYLKTRFCISVPVRDKEGHYHLVKHMGIAFGKDKHDRLTSMINSYFIVDLFRGEPLKAGIYESNEKIKDQGTERLLELIHPFMQVDRPKGKTLNDDDILSIDLIQEVIRNGDVRKYESVKAAYDKRNLKKISFDTLKRRLTRLTPRLEWLLYLDKLPKEYDHGRNKQYLPSYNNIFELVEFLDQSGIIIQLKNYFIKKKG